MAKQITRIVLTGGPAAGKTTLMRIVAGLALADNGYVSVNGATTYEENEKERRKMGCIVEAPGLYDGLTAQQNMEARALLVNADKSRIRDILATAGLEHARDRKVKNFSLGMKQRLGIAMALLGSPKLLILDEPTNGLDPAGIQEMRALIHKLVQEVDEAGYSVAVGTATHSAGGIDMEVLVKSAETRMYLAKEEHYRLAGKTRE